MLSNIKLTSSNLSTVPITSIQTLKYSNGKWNSAIIKDKYILENKNLSFITYNVWFDTHNWNFRLNALMNIFQTYLPDFICLQEVTQNFLDNLTNQEFVQKEYYISDNFKKGYDVVILSKYPVEFYKLNLPTGMGRNLILAQLYIKNKMTNEIELTYVSTSHLESLEFNMNYREKQLKIIFEKINEAKHSFFMGDFNFDPKWKEQDQIDKSYLDAWVSNCIQKNLKEEDGFTMPANEQFKEWRPDRLLYKSNIVNLKSFEIIGKENIPINPNESYSNVNVKTPSDHYGLYSLFEILNKF
jgi:tyrosyl-DNA phosphodiesterase 2